MVLFAGRFRAAKFDLIHDLESKASFVSDPLNPTLPSTLLAANKDAETVELAPPTPLPV